MNTSVKSLALSAGASVALLVGAGSASAGSSAEAVLKTYSDIAHAGYEDSLTTAKALKSAVDALIAVPSADALTAARQAWLKAREPYQQTEVYRFGNAIVDDWEGKVNAWPLDEGMIDYVSASYGTQSDENPLYTINIVANSELKIGGKPVDASAITPALLESLHEAGEVEANVSTGYHAIEFLLWGQDLNGSGAGAGNRPYTDFDTANCTGGNCDRRAAYLAAATDLLIKDLEDMVANWADGGAVRQALVGGGDKAGLSIILTGMGSLSYGELAGERMKLGLLLHDPEEEHDCFSDNTHNSHLYNARGIQNVYLGTYTRVDGSKVEGASLADLVKSANTDADAMLRAKLEATVAAMHAMRKRAEGGEAYDQMLGSGNKEGNAIVQTAIDALLEQTQAIEAVVKVLGVEAIGFEGSDSLDDPAKVFE